MAGAYEQAFEKWLGKSASENNSSATSRKEFESVSHDRLHSSNSAPFLVDDDDEEQETAEYFKNLGTGPPVLEPVSHHPHARNVFDAVDQDASRHSNFTVKHSSVSQRKIKPLEKPFKTYSAYGNTHKSPVKKKRFESESYSETKSNSENIFDKFSPSSRLYVNDSPPPLIPSTKAMAEDPCLSPQGEPEKYVVKSPDFCAMEADSTSELPSSAKGLRHSDKNQNGEISLECDSTCMLGGSPQIVSPASNSTCGDSEETRDSCDAVKQHKTVEVQCNADSFEEKPLAMAKSLPIFEDNHVLAKNEQKMSSTIGVQNNFDKKICDKVDKSVGVDLTNSSSSIGFSVDPPALAAICPIANKQQNRRKQRHTVDSAEGFSKSRKINQNNNSSSYGPPPLLSPQESGIDIFLSHSKPKGKKSKSSRTVKSKAVSDLKRPCYKRSITVPVTGSLDQDSMLLMHALWQLSQLQTRMHALLSQLWPQLRLHNMTPESPQFSSVVADLVTMLEGPVDKLNSKEGKKESSSALNSFSCEAQKPATAISDISASLKPKQSSLEISLQEEWPSAQESPASLDSDLCNNHQATLTSQQNTDTPVHPSLSSFSEKLGATSQALTHTNPSDLPPVLDMACSNDQTLAHTETSHMEQQQIPVKIESSITSLNLSNQPPSLTCNTSATTSSIPLSPSCEIEYPLSGLSKLSLADRRELCPRPVSIMLPRNPDVLLASFSSLTCKALQLLLPEVPVSLTNELSCSPKALIAFIDNVLAMNNNMKKSHRKKS
ncbi:hypothetical protein ElyMa_002380700 [Elysia marginata]|uniref:Uncharacterized protein n=1 Tax=Elysia marginata TaxID=1093978 RepID=A0AAV4GDH8_9GAST|nr:hypothetical protein ElyMa_002380700 [Elysia marginata]